jgi:hypothetical protein
MSDKTYDILKWVALLLLPALATFISTLGVIWNISYSEQISLTIMALDTFLGAILGLSSSNYKKQQQLDEDDL